ncbi:MAG: isochorismatase family cysteine hydrolase [Chloroflexota bacterium]
MNESRDFLTYLDEWAASLKPARLDDVASPAERAALVSVDMVNGFCHEGPLASPRVKALIPPIVHLMERAWAAGVRHILLAQDTHESDAVEFSAYPPHCVRGTPQAEAIPEFKALPFFQHMTIFEKNSIDSSQNTGLPAWIDEHPQVDRYLVVGDCTDLCIYQMAMHLRLDANARQLQRRVVVPADCVDTYDLPVSTAREIGAVPHDGALLHKVFLYHMMLNGVEVIASIE